MHRNQIYSLTLPSTEQMRYSTRQMPLIRVYIKQRATKKRTEPTHFGSVQ